MRNHFITLCAFLSAACTGTSLQFEYSVQQLDASGQSITPESCEAMGLTAIRLMLGNDLNQNQTLEDDEIIAEQTRDCNQRDDNSDGSLSQEELGLFTVVSFDPIEYDMFAVELRDIEGQSPNFKTFDNTSGAARFSFGGGIEIKKRLNNVIQFAGNTQQLDGELQIFIDTP
jgi:hypothetical protein